MNSIVCTLFEGHYHYGLAALVNSLGKHGFCGTVYAGYRGSLPDWPFEFRKDETVEWYGAVTVKVNESISIHFLPVQTKFHLTNYKAEFLLKIMEGPGKNADALYYFDPDIVIKTSWAFYEKWVSFGVALVHEITSNDMPSSHPLRKQWEEVIRRAGKTVKREVNSYINGGFCGVKKADVGFLHTWKKIMDIAISDFGLKPEFFLPKDRADLFYATDQDAINVATMCCDEPVSQIGPEGMDLVSGGFTMSHSIGAPKPWKKKYLLSFLKGNPPGLPDKAFWSNAIGMISLYHPGFIRFKKLTIQTASFLGRFYRRY